MNCTEKLTTKKAKKTASGTSIDFTVSITLKYLFFVSPIFLKPSNPSVRSNITYFSGRAVGTAPSQYGNFSFRRRQQCSCRGFEPFLTQHPVDFHIRCNIEQLLISAFTPQKMQINRVPHLVSEQKTPFSR